MKINITISIHLFLIRDQTLDVSYTIQSLINEHMKNSLKLVDEMINWCEITNTHSKGLKWIREVEFTNSLVLKYGWLESKNKADSIPGTR